ncbi:MAG: hypothetical protein KIT31_02175 [Deltaproteobacteria bacterium]|nr:hypothetical protein [Deltaproteobacteria bacterium]
MSATWEHVRAHVRARFKLAFDQPTWSGLRWRIGTAQVDQRIELTDAFGEPWLQVVTDVVDEEGVREHQALRENMSVPIGALAIEQGRYKLRYQLPLDDVDTAVLDRWMERLADVAARLRRTLLPPPAAATFTHYAD